MTIKRHLQYATAILFATAAFDVKANTDLELCQKIILNENGNPTDHDFMNLLPDCEALTRAQKCKRYMASLPKSNDLAKNDVKTAEDRNWFFKECTGEIGG